MDKVEKKIEQVSYDVERERIHKQRLDAQNAAEIRKGKIENRENMEIDKSFEGKPLSKVHTTDEAANLRRKYYYEGKYDDEKLAQQKTDHLIEGFEKSEAGQHDGARLEQLAHSKNLNDVQSKELQEKLGKYIDKTDPYRNNADRLTNEGLSKFETNGTYRREFSHLAGTTEHSRWENEILNLEKTKGRIRGTDFELEAVMKHPDGKLVRLDYVDYRKGIIIDRKSIEISETEEQLKRKYERQRSRHIEAYEHTTGQKVLEYNYSLYPSPRDI